MKISLPIIVEGRYDKSALSGYIDAVIVTTGGFSVFNNKEKQLLIKKLGKDGIIVLTDSDAGGKQIRSFLSSILPKDKIYHLYTPKIEGKEARKARPSKAGVLGVEGVDSDVLIKILSPFADGGSKRNNGKMITKVDFYNDKLTGFPDSKARRAELARSFDLPDDMTANALLEAINLLFGYDEYKSAVSSLSE